MLTKQVLSTTNLVFDISFDSESNGLHGMQETQTASNKIEQTVAYLSNPITSSSVLLSVPKPPPYALRPNCLGLPQQGTATDDIPRHQKCLRQWTRPPHRPSLLILPHPTNFPNQNRLLRPFGLGRCLISHWKATRRTALSRGAQGL